MVEISGLTAGYGGEPVLRDVTLAFPPGEVTVLLGPNGCGKSTLLRSVIGLVPHVRGEIRIGGSPAPSQRERAREVAYLPQSRPTPDMTVGQLVLHGRFPWLGYPRRYRREDHAAAGAAMERLGISELADIPLARLSGGTRQKCFIAMALAQDSPTILMDEPLNSLDISHRLRLMALTRELAAEGKAIALVLHDIPLALEYAHRIAVMEAGRIQTTGTPEEVYRSGILEKVFGVRLQSFHAGQEWAVCCKL